MAIYKNGINGPLSGKIGNVIASSWKGINYLKSVNGHEAKPGSGGQLYQRSLLGVVSSWLRPLRDLIWVGFQAFTEAKTPMNAAISFVMREAVIKDGALPRIDFPKVIFSRGELLISFVEEVAVLADARLEISWRGPVGSAFAKVDDRATFVLYNPAKEQFVAFENVASRVDGRVMLQLPLDFKGDSVHGYMHYVNAEGNAVSTSLYVGEVTVI